MNPIIAGYSQFSALGQQVFTELEDTDEMQDERESKELESVLKNKSLIKKIHDGNQFYGMPQSVAATQAMQQAADARTYFTLMLGNLDRSFSPFSHSSNSLVLPSLISSTLSGIPSYYLPTSSDISMTTSLGGFANPYSHQCCYYSPFTNPPQTLSTVNLSISM